MGVWIETARNYSMQRGAVVTPCMGVWIETWHSTWNPITSSGHTLYGCVDWNLRLTVMRLGLRCHTLYGCVDWNVYCCHILISYCVSHPVWVCGLKLIAFSIKGGREKVTPCMGVWIETWKERFYYHRQPVTPCMGVWIETSHRQKHNLPKLCHTLYGCVDWNLPVSPLMLPES